MLVYDNSLSPAWVSLCRHHKSLATRKMEIGVVQVRLFAHLYHNAARWSRIGERYARCDI